MTAADILQPIARDQLRQVLIGFLQSSRDQVTDWHSGGVRRTQLEYVSLVLDDFLRLQLPALADAPNLETAPNSAWVRLAADQLFDLQGAPPVLALQIVLMTCAVGSGPYTLVPGFVLRGARTGNRYYAITGGTLTTSTPLIVTVQAEGPDDPARGVAYNDGPGEISILESPLLGVTASNQPPQFSAITTTPSPTAGTGGVGFSSTGTPAPAAYDFEIVADGQNTTAAFRWRTNGGAWSAPIAMAPTFPIPSTAITMNFANDGGGGDPSFRAGDVYSFSTPGSPILQASIPGESDAALIARCFARWSSLEPGARVPEKHLEWAQAADPTVKRLKAVPDLSYPGRLLITIAGAPGTPPLSSGVVADVQTAIDRRESWGVLPLVSAATVTTVIASGTITVVQGQRAIVQALAQTLFSRYVAATDIGGVVRVAVVEALLMDAGAVDVVGLELNGAPGNVTLASTAIGQAASLDSMAWLEAV